MMASGEERLNELVTALGPRRRRVMKRCFMTGRQCRFASQLAEGAHRRIDAENLSVFVIMPFAPNIETAYRWSLKPFLVDGYGLPEGHVQRADEVRDIGYIVCEKICRMIQGADLVLAEISMTNTNVFYELGLAYGLERPVVLMRTSTPPADVLEDSCVKQCLNDPKQLLEYPGVDLLSIDSHQYRLDTHVTRPPGQPRAAKRLHISILQVERGEAGQAVSEGGTAPAEADISLEFHDVLSGAIGVAMHEIRAEVASDDAHSDGQLWTEVLRNIGDKPWGQFTAAELIRADGRQAFDDIAKQLASSFCTVIDISRGDPVAYFWLGYCHAHGLSAIPVRRLDEYAGDSQTDKTLAFDIQALWYAEYDPARPYEFKTKMREILEHLLEQELPERQKRAFWDRFPPEQTLKVFTGAIHNREMNREMVGDWDVRTISELSSYLPSIREAGAIELVTPLYAPEEAYKRTLQARQVRVDAAAVDDARQTEAAVTAQGQPGALEEAGTTRTRFIEEYRRSINEELSNASAIVIASSDVNPVTEYVLHRTYGVEHPSAPFEGSPAPRFSGYVALKRLVQRAEMGTDEDEHEFPRLFYVQQTIEEDDEPNRGFAKYAEDHLSIDERLMKGYYSQDECVEEFYLLGHLVISFYAAQETHRAESQGRTAARGALNPVLLLNGVSGPATFALAQILTGGGLEASHEMNSRSELMLEEINRALDEGLEIPGCTGIEAIIQVTIAPAGEASSRTYMDTRGVKEWEFLELPRPIIPMSTMRAREA